MRRTLIRAAEAAAESLGLFARSLAQLRPALGRSHRETRRRRRRLLEAAAPAVRRSAPHRCATHLLSTLGAGSRMQRRQLYLETGSERRRSTRRRELPLGLLTGEATDQFCRPSSPVGVLRIMSSSLRRKLSMTISKSDRKNSTFKVVILGQAAVGKTALTVRFMTRRFIWDYDPNLESKYSFSSTVDGEAVQFEIIDTAGQDEGSARIEENIKWADAFILVYSITDSSSLFSCDRYKFLVNNYARRKKKSAPGNVAISGGAGSGSGAGPSSPPPPEWPVALVGNKSDLAHERSVQRDVGEQAARKLACTHFHDISVRESYEDAKKVFDDLYRYYKNPRALVRRTVSSDTGFIKGQPPRGADGVGGRLAAAAAAAASAAPPTEPAAAAPQRDKRGGGGTGGGGSSPDEPSVCSPSGAIRRPFFDSRPRRKHDAADLPPPAAARMASSSIDLSSRRHEREEFV